MKEENIYSLGYYFDNSQKKRYFAYIPNIRSYWIVGNEIQICQDLVGAIYKRFPLNTGTVETGGYFTSIENVKSVVENCNCGEFWDTEKTNEMCKETI